MDDNGINMDVYHLSHLGIILPSLLGIMMTHSRETVFNQLVYIMRWEKRGIFFWAHLVQFFLKRQKFRRFQDSGEIITTSLRPHWKTWLVRGIIPKWP